MIRNGVITISCAVHEAGEGHAMASQARQRRSAPPSAPASTEPDVRRGELRQFYRDMVLIRRFEERSARAYTEALVGGYCHLNLGEEAAVIGLMAALKPAHQ